MNICFVYDCEYPWDIRVEKIAKSFLKEGHQVHLVARNFDSDPCESMENGIHVHRLPYSLKKILTKVLNITLFFNPVWLYTILKTCRQNRCSLIVVRDLPLALAAILVGKFLKLPVIVDMAEPYPLTVKQRLQNEPFKPFHLLSRNYLLADITEKLVLFSADHIFVVCREAKNRLIERGAKPSRISIVRNTPELDKFYPKFPSYPGIMAKLKDDFVILYVGLIIGGRGIDSAIYAMEKISQISRRIKLVIVGNGKLESEMRELVKEKGLQKVVYFEGWVENKIVPEYIASCSIGLLPFQRTEHISHTLANKFYDFMAMGKAMLVSDVTPMKRMINETDCGICFEAENPDDLAEKIQSVAADPNGLGKKEKIGPVFIERKYNWSKDTSKIIDTVNCMVNKNCVE